MTVRNFFTKHLALALGSLFSSIFLLDIFVFGEGGITNSALKGLPSYFNPLLATIWFSEALSFVVLAGIVVIYLKPRILRLLPVVTMGLALLLFSSYIVIGNYSNNLPPDQYNNPIGKTYEILHNTVPYYVDGNSENDWSLTSTIRPFIVAQVPFIVGLIVGAGLSHIMIRGPKRSDK